MPFRKIQNNKNLILVSLAFSLIIGIYRSTQPLLTKLHDDLGYYALALLYLVFAISLLVVAPLVKRLGPKISMILGSLFFIAFQFIQIDAIPWLYLTICGLTGLGSAVIWTGIGTFMVKISTPEKIGKNTGFFYMVLTLGNLFGNSLASVLLNVNNISFSTLFLIFAFFPLVGILFFFPLAKKKKKKKKIEIDVPEAIVTTPRNDSKSKSDVKNILKAFNLSKSDDSLLKPIKINHFSSNNPKTNKKTKTRKTKVQKKIIEKTGKTETKQKKIKKAKNQTKGKSKAQRRTTKDLEERVTIKKPKKAKLLSKTLSITFKLLITKKAILAVQGEIVRGMVTAFGQGFLPMLIEDRHISIVILCFSFSFALFSLINGILTDKMGKLKLFLANFMIIIVGCIMCFFLTGRPLYYFIIVYIVFSIGLSGISNIDFPLTSVLFPKRIENGIALFKFVKSITSAISFLYVGKISLYQNLYIIIIVNIMAMASLIYLDKKICPIDPQFSINKKKKKNKKSHNKNKSLDLKEGKEVEDASDKDVESSENEDSEDQETNTPVERRSFLFFILNILNSLDVNRLV
ncbi:et translation product-related [Anaeramoeba flamelloides]|uniref:Et translation product-related n=1 Tax=Anaeramoeba flamelloides TaxID=1746091 RepID=A0AAV7YZX2_9EUKA|nr:et translation product-related [Anaeramoeba flamelloides]